MEWVNGKHSMRSGLGSIGVLGWFHLNTRWARVSSIVDAGLEELEDIMGCDK